MKRILSGIAGLVVVVLTLTGCGSIDDLKDPAANAAEQTTPEATATETVTETPTAECPAEFVQNPVTYTDNRVNDELTEQFDVVMTNVANGGEISQELKNLLTGFTVRDARLLAIYSHQIGLHDNPNNWAGLVTEDRSCLSSEGQTLYAMYKGALSASGATVEQTEAPQDWYNSGARGENGEFVIGEDIGVRGDTRAIKVTLSDGTVAIILVRCGNPVFPAPPAGVPTGPTDNPPPEVPQTPDKPYVPHEPDEPSTPVTPNPKRIEEAPQRQGNLPTQQQPNPLPARPDHEQPAQPTNPPESYTAPTTPAPAPLPSRAPENPAPIPTRDPAPPPPPEPAAPAPSAPETGCIPIPGVEEC